MVNTPLPSSVKSEAKKAAKILEDFTLPSSKSGPDKLIPVSVILKARGLAILTVVKLGFLVTARGGSGIVIARLNDGSWSPPSAIGIAGLGGGFELGAEVTDFVIILNTQAAVEAFSKGGNLTFGGNFTVAAGPLGRNVEADVAVKSPAAIFSYSKTKGLFAGISIEGSGLIERKDANKKFYGEHIRAHQILNGLVERPPGCDPLYNVLEKQTSIAAELVADKVKKKAKESARKVSNSSKASDSSKASESSFFSRFDFRSASTSSKRKHSTQSLRSSTPPPGDRRPSCDSLASKYKPSSSSGYKGGGDRITSSRSFKQSAPKPSSDSWASARSSDPWASVRPKTTKVRALHDYTAELPCDISFREGDEITVLTMTDTQNDWWEGCINGKTGIFPANFTMVMK